MADDATAIRRRRECLACGRRYTTYERVEDVPVVVRKRSGSAEPFDRGKLRAGIERAATGRLDGPTIDASSSRSKRSCGPTAVRSPATGSAMAVLERLRALDPVAYLRFASVYKGFEKLSDFEREVGELQKTTAPKRR